MKKVWQKLGTVVFWALWPALVVYVRRSERTRLLVVCGQKVVVVKDWLGSGKWTLPGGGLHTGEEPLPGVLREVAEETGIQLAATQVRSFFTEEYRARGMRFNCHYFLAELPETLPLKAQFWEIAELAWLDQAQLNTKNANPDVLAALRKLAARPPRK